MVDLDTVIHLIQSHGLLLLAPLAIVEGPIVTVIGGYLASLSLLNLAGVFIVVVLADLAGDSLLYGLGRFGTGRLSPCWRGRLGLQSDRIARLVDHFEIKGGRTLVFGKLTHSAGAIILAAAGAARMPFGAFIWYNLLATVPKSLVFLSLGYAFGSAYAQIDNWIFRVSLVLLGGTVLLVAAWFAHRGWQCEMTRPAPPSVSCIIAAFNEADRIAGVLAALSGHPGIAEIIVVDDGSADGTARVAEAVADVRVIRLSPNRGKTWALSVGIEAAAHPLLLLLDADLLGLTPDDLTALIVPVQQGRADVAISLRGNAPRLWHLIGLDYISGERVLPRALLAERTEDLRRLPRFGFEVHLNGLLIDRRSRLAVVRWPNVKSPMKTAKRGLLLGIRSDVRMMQDIFRTVPPVAALRQIIRLRRQRIGHKSHP